MYIVFFVFMSLYMSWRGK